MKSFKRYVSEKLKASDDMADWIDDFEKSDAPQFKGKSKEKRREMAIAAKYAAEREAGMREATASEIANAGRAQPAKAGNTKAYYAAKASAEAQPKSKVSLKKAPWEKNEEVELDEGIIKPYHAIGKQPWSKTVKDSKGTAGEYKQIAKGKDFTVWYAYRGSNKSFPHYVVKDDKIIGSGMTVKAALKDAGLKEKDLTNRSKFTDGSPLNKGMKESLEQVDEILDTPKAMQSYRDKNKRSKEKAASSAAAKIIRGPDKDGQRADHSPELKTMAKRRSGEKMADRLAGRKTLKLLRAKPRSK